MANKWLCDLIQNWIKCWSRSSEAKLIKQEAQWTHWKCPQFHLPWDRNMECHIVKARFSSLYHMWQDHTFMKLRLYKATVFSSLTHLCEAWDLIKSLNGLNSRCLHMITMKNYHSTATAYDYNLILAMWRHRIRFIGHLMRMDNNRLLKRSFIACARRPLTNNRFPSHGLSNENSKWNFSSTGQNRMEHRRVNTLL